jgi:hypothetical protein
MRKMEFKQINNKLEKAYNIEVKQTNKGYNITGVNNGKIIRKSVRYIDPTTKIKTNKKKTNKKKTNKKKTNKK